MWCAAETGPCISGSAWKMSVYTSHFTAFLDLFRHQPGEFQKSSLDRLRAAGGRQAVWEPPPPPLYHSPAACCSAPGTRFARSRAPHGESLGVWCDFGCPGGPFSLVFGPPGCPARALFRDSVPTTRSAAPDSIPFAVPAPASNQRFPLPKPSRPSPRWP